MKILFVCDTLGPGGAERVISTLSNEFVCIGNSVSIILLSNEYSQPFYKLNPNIKIISLYNQNSTKLSFLRKAKQLKQLVVKLKPDIVISFLSYVCIYTWWALRKTNIPYIVSERNDPNHRGKMKQFLLNKSFKKASGCVFQTEDAMTWYHKIIKSKLRIIYNPVKLDYQPSQIGELSKQILYVGRLTDQKNCLMLLNAFEIFHTKHQDYVLKIYGDGPLRDNLVVTLFEKHLENCVHVFPSNKTWQKDECNSSLFVLASRHEGMPNVLAEALSLGIPCVSTNCTIGGPKELKKLFPNQLILSQSDNPEEFASAMEEAICIPHTLPHVPEELKENNIVEQWLEFINDIVRGSNSVR